MSQQPPTKTPNDVSPLQFSIVIPTCRRNDALVQCLDRLKPGIQTYSARYEVIVTDDSTRAEAEAELGKNYPWVRFVKGPSRGPAANRNHGAALARGDWLVFTDDDCLPDTGWLSAFAREITSDDSPVLEGRTVPFGKKMHPLEECPINTDGGNLWSCNFAIKHSLFTALRGFDERFPYAAMEDVEFRERVMKLQHAIRFIPAAVVQHPWKKINLEQHTARHSESTLIYVQVNPEKRILIDQKVLVRQGMRQILRSYFKELGRWPLRSHWVFFQRLAALRQRKRIYGQSIQRARTQ